MMHEKVRRALARPGQECERYRVQGVVRYEYHALAGEVAADRPQDERCERARAGTHARRIGLHGSQVFAQLERRRRNRVAGPKIHYVELVRVSNEGEHMLRPGDVLDEHGIVVAQPFHEFCSAKRRFDRRTHLEQRTNLLKQPIHADRGILVRERGKVV